MKNCPLCSSLQQERWSIPQDGYEYWICGECKLIWLDPRFRPDREQEKARYDTHQNAVDDEIYLAYLSKTFAPLITHLPKGARGLDFGCGPTEGMKTMLQKHGFRVESYDPFYFPRESLLKNHYDFVTCCEVVEHFFSPAKEFARLSELVQEGGWLGIATRFAVRQEAFPQWYYRRDPTHVVFYQAETAAWIAQACGWKIHFLEDPLWVFQKLSSGGRKRL